MIAMTHASYVLTGWIGTGVLLGAYALSVVRRGRVLSRRVPAQERRWS